MLKEYSWLYDSDPCMNVEYHQYHGDCRLEYDPGGRLCPKDVADDHLGVSKQEMNNVWFS